LAERSGLFAPRCGSAARVDFRRRFQRDIWSLA
jgi:hypothetical protein